MDTVCTQCCHLTSGFIDYCLVRIGFGWVPVGPDILVRDFALKPDARAVPVVVPPTTKHNQPTPRIMGCLSGMEGGYKISAVVFAGLVDLVALALGRADMASGVEGRRKNESGQF